MAIRLTIEGNIDNNTGQQPMMRDFFLEGFSVIPAAGMSRKKPKECTIF